MTFLESRFFRQRAFAALLIWNGLFLRTELRADTEYDVKAAQLFNFTKFVTWPAAAFDNAASPLVIGILGDDPFGGAVDEIVRGQKVAGHSITVLRSRNAAALKGCHVVFISNSEAGKLANVLGVLKGANALTVSDIPQFTRKAGMIEFIIDGGRIRFKINGEATRASGLSVFSQLRKLAAPD